MIWWPFRSAVPVEQITANIDQLIRVNHNIMETLRSLEATNDAQSRAIAALSRRLSELEGRPGSGDLYSIAEGKIKEIIAARRGDAT